MEGFVITWWMWFLFGLFLLLVEFLTPGAFYQLFFGVGAIAVGVLQAAGIQMSLPVQGVLFLVISLGALLLLRKPLREKLCRAEPGKPVDSLEGETAVALEDIAVDGIGKAELRGTAWNARNVGDSPISRSQRCRVERVDGLTLWVRV